MASLKCPDCGLTNFATATSCKRCQSPLTPVVAAATQPDHEPQAARSDQLSGSVRRDGALLVMSTDDVLPMRCVMCNKTSADELELKVEWRPRYLYWYVPIMAAGSLLYYTKLDKLLVDALHGLNFAIFVFLYISRRKEVTVFVGLCQAHLSKRLYGAIAGGSLVGLGLLTGLVIAFNRNYMLIPIAIGLTIAGAFVIVLLRRIVTACKIEEEYVWLKGANKNFLESLA